MVQAYRQRMAAYNSSVAQMRSLRLAAVLVALIVVAGYDFAQRRALGALGGFPLDDSWIHLQFARQLAKGDGLTYNDGEWVNGSTAPLWTALISLAPSPRLLAFWAKGVGVALYLVSILLVFRLGLLYGLRPPWVFVLTILVSLASWMPWSALSGMEIPLFLVLSLGALVLHGLELRDASRLPLALPIAALGYFARPESALLFCLLAAEQGLRVASGEGPRRRFVHGVLVSVLVLAPLLVTFLTIGGSLLPTTFMVKAEIARPGPINIYLLRVVGIFLHPLPWMVVFAGAGIVEVLRRRHLASAPVLWLLGLPVGYAWLTRSNADAVGNFGRYYFPLIPVVCLLGVLGLRRACAAAVRRVTGARLRLLAKVAIGLIVLLPSVNNVLRGARFYARNVGDVEISDGAMARWLAPRLAPEAVLGVHDIGLLKFLLPNRLIDFGGIISPELTLRRRAAIGPADPRGAHEARRFMEERKPDYLIFWESWLPRVVGEPGFKPLRRLENPAHVTMGGPVLTLYSTPWTRYPLRVLEGDIPP